MKRITAFIILFLTVFLTILLIIVLSADDPAAAIEAFFIGPWNGVWFGGNTLDGVCLLLTAGLGAFVSFQAGCFNLGCEGQVYAGGLAAAFVLLVLPPSGGSVWVGAFAAAAAAGVMGFVSGFLKRYAGANEIITSFLLSAAFMPFADYLIAGPLRDPSGSLLATAPITQLPRILPPSNLSVSFIAAILLVATVRIFFNDTVFGYRLKIASSAPDFARYAGIETSRFWIPAMTASGALCGLAGFFAVSGTYGRCHVGFPGGLGWNAIAVALIAGNRPLFLFPAALIYGALNAGAESAMLATGLQFETSSFIQALILLFSTLKIFRAKSV